MLDPTPTERHVLRQLAAEIAELAASPSEAVKRRRWTALNRLESDGPMIQVLPDDSWDQLLPPLTLDREPFRSWERQLRQRLTIAREIGDDTPINPTLDIPWRFHLRHWADLPFATRSDPARIAAPHIEVDEEASIADLTLAGMMVGDLLRVRRRTDFPVLLYGPISRARDIRGLSHLHLDLYEDPDWVEGLLGHLTQQHLQLLDELEAGNWLSLNNEADTIHCGGIGSTDQLPAADTPPGEVNCQDLWGGLVAEALAGTSRNQFERVFLPSVLPVLSRYGLACFGGNESIEEWIQGLRQLPNLRRLSIAADADIEGCSRQIKKRYVFSYKQDPSAIEAARVDWAGLFQDLLEPLTTIHGYKCHLEIVLRGIGDLHGETDRLSRWVETVRQAIEVVYD